MIAPRPRSIAAPDHLPCSQERCPPELGRARLARLVPWAAMLLPLAALAALFLSRLDYFAWSDDEAVLVMTAHAVDQGHALYDTVWYNYLPGLVQLFRLAYALGGYSLTSARVSAFLCAILGLAGLVLLVRRTAPVWGGPVALALLGLAPHFVALSSAAMADVPSAALAVWCVWGAIAYLRRGRGGYLLASGLAYALSIWLKPTSAFTAAVPLVAIWVREGAPRRRFEHLVSWVAIVLLTLTAGLVGTNPLGFARLFLATYGQSRNAFAIDLGGNLRELGMYFLFDKYTLTHVSWLFLGALGARALLKDDRPVSILLLTWLGAVLITLLSHAPLYRHHLVQLLFPIVALTSVGTLRALSTCWRGRRGYARWASAALLLLVVETGRAIYVDAITLPRIEADRFEIAEDAVRYLVDATPPGSQIITDGQMIALRAGRAVPPGLTNTSRMRIKTGQLTDQAIIGIAQRTQPEAVVYWERKLELLDGFDAWVVEHYDLAVAYSERHRIYRLRPDWP